MLYGPGDRAAFSTPHNRPCPIVAGRARAIPAKLPFLTGNEPHHSC